MVTGSSDLKKSSIKFCREYVSVISQMNLEVVCYMLYNVDFQVR